MRVSVLLSVMLASAMDASPSLTKKVMPLGDSITVWNTVEECARDHCITVSGVPSGQNCGIGGGYRTLLGGMLKGTFRPSTGGYQEVRDEGTKRYLFDFVGSQHSLGDHEGHSGFTFADHITFAADVLTQHQPDIIMMLLGTNDMLLDGANITLVSNRMRTLLDIIFRTLPRVHVISSAVTHLNVAQCKKTNCSNAGTAEQLAETIKAFNLQAPQIVEAYAAHGHSIEFFEMNDEAGFVDVDYYCYGIHFVSTGWQKMANAWMKYITPHLNYTAATQNCKGRYSWSECDAVSLPGSRMD